MSCVYVRACMCVSVTQSRTLVAIATDVHGEAAGVQGRRHGALPLAGAHLLHPDSAYCGDDITHAQLADFGRAAWTQDTREEEITFFQTLWKIKSIHLVFLQSGIKQHATTIRKNFGYKILEETKALGLPT